MCFPKNFSEVLRTPILQNVDRLLLLKHLLKMKAAAPDKFLILMRPKLNVQKTHAMYTNAVATYLEYQKKLGLRGKKNENTVNARFTKGLQQLLFTFFG